MGGKSKENNNGNVDFGVAMFTEGFVEEEVKEEMKKQNNSSSH